MAESYELDKPDNLVEMWEQSARKNARREFLGTKVRGEYVWASYEEVARRIDHLRGGLAKLGVDRGDSVAIIANNRVEWAVACYATYGRGARFVPMYEVELPQIWKYIVEDSGAKVLFVSSEEIFEKTKGFVDEIDSLDHILRIEGEGEGTMADLEATGRKEPATSVHPDAEEIAGLIYTSGTTGAPKGVLLSHGNLTSNVHALLKAYHMLNRDMRSLSFLPWAHAYGQVAELHTLMHLGASTGFAESPQTIVTDLALVRPTMLLAVPRVFNRVYDGLHKKIGDQGGVAKLLFETGLAAAAERRKAARRGEPPGLATRLRLAVADAVVFKKVRDKFGGRLELACSSSAALSPEIAYFFEDIGIPVYEGWGMTELSPAATLNTPESFKVGSVGKPIDKVRIEIDKSVTEGGAKDGEVVVYGPNVMKGYHGKAEATAEVLTDDGGIRTGDRGYVDEDGFLVITGRIKEQFKLENGKYVFPAAVEEEIKLVAEVEHAMIHGVNKPFTVCIVVPDFLVLEPWAREEGVPQDHAKMVTDSKVRALFERKIRAQLSGKFGSYEIPKKLLLLDEPFTTDNGMLTPTLKLKRRKVLERYADDIEALYA